MNGFGLCICNDLWNLAFVHLRNYDWRFYIRTKRKAVSFAQLTAIQHQDIYLFYHQ